MAAGELLRDARVVCSCADAMFKRLSEWRVDGQVVSAELDLRTGRETIAIDSRPVFDKISWKLRNEIPLELDGGRRGRVVVSVRWNLTPRCVLEVEGEAIEPHIRPVLSKVRRVVIGVGIVLLAGFFGLMIGPWILGGSELPPPRWAVQDLTPMPDEGDNAWHAIVGSMKLPERDRWLLDHSERISPSDLPTAEDDLARPEVVALLARVPEVLEHQELAVPDDESCCANALQLREWRYWLALSLSTELEHEPVRAARTVARTLPLWIDCANTARATEIFLICAKQAELDLTLMSNTLEHMPRGQNETRALIETSVREAPALSTQNLMRALYIESYDLLSSVAVQHDIWVDKRATLERFNRLLSPGSIDAFCEAPGETDLYWALYVYNYLGDRFAEAAAGWSCVGFDRVNASTESVADARRELLKTLEQPLETVP